MRKQNNFTMTFFIPLTSSIQSFLKFSGDIYSKMGKMGNKSTKKMTVEDKN